jgi:DUF1009 family protein
MSKGYDSIGLIAGNGCFPLLFSRELKKAQPFTRLVVAGLRGEVSRDVLRLADAKAVFGVGEIESIMAFFRDQGVTHLLMLGKITPLRVLLSRPTWDAAAKGIAARVSDFRAHTILSAIIDAFGEQGFSFVDTTLCMGAHLAHEGVNNAVTLPSSLSQECAQAVALAQRIVDTDVGQTIVFKDKVIVAVEAFEGTDKTIMRAGKEFGRGIIAVKRAKNGHDMRFDLPVIGERTIALLKTYRCKALLVHAGKTMFMDKSRVMRAADKAGIPIVGYP